MWQNETTSSYGVPTQNWFGGNAEYIADPVGGEKTRVIWFHFEITDLPAIDHHLGHVAAFQYFTVRSRFTV